MEFLIIVAFVVGVALALRVAYRGLVTSTGKKRAGLVDIAQARSGKGLILVGGFITSFGCILALAIGSTELFIFCLLLGPVVGGLGKFVNWWNWG